MQKSHTFLNALYVALLLLPNFSIMADSATEERTVLQSSKKMSERARKIAHYVKGHKIIVAGASAATLLSAGALLAAVSAAKFFLSAPSAPGAALAYFARNGSALGVINTLGNGGVTQEDKDKALADAAFYTKNNVLWPLLVEGARPNSQPRGARLSGSILENAAYSGNTEGVKALLQAGANPDGGREMYPLAVALHWGRSVCVQALLNAGANPNGPANCEHSPLYYALNSKGLTAHGKADAIEKLYKKGATSLTFDEAASKRRNDLGLDVNDLGFHDPVLCMLKNLKDADWAGHK